MTDECDGSSLNRENGYAKLKKNKNKVKGLLICTLIFENQGLEKSRSY